MIRLFDFDKVPTSDILTRGILTEENVDAAVDAVLAAVRAEGDAALRSYEKQFDGAELDGLFVTEAELDAAEAQVDPELLETLHQAAENIRAFHSRQTHNDFVLTDKPGVVMGQRYTPIESVGVCVPGTPVAFPSTVLMDVIPAKIAGVREIIMATPPAPDGTIAPAALAAARIAGVTKILKCGGAQAVAAMAYGTESVPKVDKIVGPGGVYVAAAKRKVFGLVSIDMIAGPSEILVMADGKSDPRWVAADMLSQAEHDRLSSAVLVTDSRALAEAVRDELEVQLETLPRREVAQASIDNNGKIIITDSLEKAAEAANCIAPEHLELCVDEPFALLPRIRNAGSVFLGRNAPEALGDYFAGPNHTLPTSGTARFSSPLSVDDFVKKSSFLYYTGEALQAVSSRVQSFARQEGLEAHARAIAVRDQHNGKGSAQ